MKLNNVLSFRTNDPVSPEPAINVSVSRVRGGVSTVPTEAVFAPVQVGTEAIQILDIRDGAKQPRAVLRVQSTSPDTVVVRLLPRPVGSEIGQHPAGALVGRLEVKLRAKEVGAFRGEVLIYAQGEPTPSKVLVMGRGASLVEASPSALVLPRASNNGPIYSGFSVCRNVEGKPITLSIASTLPEGLLVEFPSGSGSGPRLARVTWDPVRGKALAGRGPVPVKLTADVAGQSIGFELQVVCQEGGGG
jgi:hypothetical protein